MSAPRAHGLSDAAEDRQGFAPILDEPRRDGFEPKAS